VETKGEGDDNAAVFSFSCKGASGGSSGGSRLHDAGDRILEPAIAKLLPILCE
jgi:hypothetical protein